MEIFSIDERQARRYKAKYEENGWIKSKKGQHDSKVWLAFKPDTTTFPETRRVRVDTEFKEKQNQIITKISLD